MFYHTLLLILLTHNMHLMRLNFEGFFKRMLFILDLLFCYHVPLNYHQFLHVNVL